MINIIYMCVCIYIVKVRLLVGLPAHKLTVVILNICLRIYIYIYI